MSTAHATAEPRLLDAFGRPRSPATYPGAGRGNTPRNKGRKYPPQPYTPDEAQRLLRACVPTSKHAGSNAVLGGERLLACCVLLYRSGLRVQEALDLEERDLDRDEKLITVRCGKGGKRRVVGMDAWGWRQLDHWLRLRVDLPPGPLFPTIYKGQEGRSWDQGDLRRALRISGQRAGLRRRCTPHAFRHTFAVEAWREGVDILSLQRQLGHARLSTTQAYLVGLGADDLLTPVVERKTPMVPMTV